MVDDSKVVELQIIEPQLLHELVVTATPSEVKTAILDKKIPVDQGNELNQTALHVACEAGREDVVSLLLEFNANVRLPDIEGINPLIAASKSGSISCVKLLINARADVQACDNVGWTPLMWACYKGYTEIAKILLYEGASVHVHVAYNMTCLLWAAGRGHSAIVRMLCEKGAKVNATDKFGSTALMWACRRGYIGVVNILFDFKADADAVGANGANALIAATQNGHEDCVKAILTRGSVNVNHTDKDTNSALSYAAKLGKYGSIILLLNAGAYLNLVDKNGDTPLIKAIKHSHLEAVRALLSRFADVDIRGKHDSTALHSACDLGHIGIVRELLACNADTEAVTDEGETPLLRAVKNKNVTISRMLLDKGAKVNATDKKKDTPLHIAIRARSLRLVKLLLRNPKDSRLLYQPNKAGETPYNLDAAHNKGILGSVFGAKNLSPENAMNEVSGDGIPQSYDLYSSALADILCEPTLTPPLTVGLYAKWGSGKSFLLKRLEEQMKVFTSANKLEIFQRPSFASFVFVFVISVFLGLLTSTLTSEMRVAAGAIVGCSIFFIYSLIASLVAVGVSVGSWRWAFAVGNFAHNQYSYLLLLSNLWFMKPPAMKQVQNGKAIPVRFLFTTYSRLTSVGGETSLAEMIGLLSVLAEKNLGFFAVRLYRAFKSDIQGQTLPVTRYRKICCIPTFLLAILFLIVTGAVVLLVTATYGPSPTLLEDSSSENATSPYYQSVMLGSTIVLASLDLLLVVLALPTLAAMCGSLLWSQRSRVLSSALHTKSLERLMQQLKQEVDLLSQTVTAIDAFTGTQTRMCVIINGLDSCEQDKVLQVLDTVHVLFSQRPFITILAIDPVIISKAIHSNLNSVFRHANISGHDYLKNLVHLPFYLKDKTQITQKNRSVVEREDGSSDGETDPEELTVVADAGRKSSKAGMLPYRRANGVRRSHRSIDLSKLMFSEDWFNSVSPQLMKRILNIVSLTGRLLRADRIEFSWGRLAAWINLTEQWPYRTSFILHTLNKSENTIPPTELLRNVFDQSPFCLSPNDPMLTIDSSDDRSFRAFLSARFLTVRDVRDFLPSTLNLDPKLCELISQDPYGQVRQDSIKRINSQTSFSHSQYHRLTNEPTLEPQVVSPTTPSFPKSHSGLSPFSGINSYPNITDWSTVEVAQQLHEIRGIVPTNLQRYEDFIHSNNVNGSVLVACDLDDLKKELFAPFGDWSLIKQWILKLRTYCIPDDRSDISGSTRTYQQPHPHYAEKEAKADVRLLSRPENNAPIAVMLKDSEESLDFNSLRGSDRVAYDKAFKEYLRLQPDTSDNISNTDADRISVGDVTNGNKKPDQSSRSSDSSETCKERIPLIPVNDNDSSMTRDDVISVDRNSARRGRSLYSITPLPCTKTKFARSSVSAEDVLNGNGTTSISKTLDNCTEESPLFILEDEDTISDMNANLPLS